MRAVGKQVGRYQIQQRIGQGAMANVYRAYDPGIDRVLAIKVLKRDYCRDPASAARFLREAKAAGALSHPNIVTIYDVGEIEGFPYIAMELLEGEPLDRAAKRIGQFPIADVLDIGAQLADALCYAHGQGVVHRDIKPSNIMLGPDGRSVKLLDFGIARVAEAEAASEQLKTQIGQVLGTPRYMSPEQALGRELDGRSDLFSLGVVLYELITGQPAFNGASAATVALQITQQEPAPIEVTPECPRGLKFIIGKLLAKRPDKRFDGGKALHDALVREKQANTASGGEGRNLPLQLRLMVQMAAITAIALAIGVSIVLTRQSDLLKEMAVASGASVATFAAHGAALEAANNANLPPESRDWRTAQNLVDRASDNPNVAQMLIADADGIIRAASDETLIGARYAPPTRRSSAAAPDVATSVSTVTGLDGAENLRFSRAIDYYGQAVGRVDVSMRTDELRTIADLTRAVLFALGALTLVLVTIFTFAAARELVEPLRRLKRALKDAAAGDFDFRISHRRTDEFGELFDAFNALAAAAQERIEHGAVRSSSPPRLVTDEAPAEKAARG